MEKDSIVVELNPIRPNAKRVIFARAIRQTNPAPCFFCRTATVRATAVKVDGDQAWKELVCCDWCFDAMRGLEGQMTGL